MDLPDYKQIEGDGARLGRLEAGMVIPYGGDRQAAISEQLALDFKLGDRLIVVQESGELLHVPREAADQAASAISRAAIAFKILQSRLANAPPRRPAWTVGLCLGRSRGG